MTTQESRTANDQDAVVKKPSRQDILQSLDTGDIVDDILRRVIEMAPSFKLALAQQIAADVRKDWGGGKTYVAGAGAIYREARDKSIIQAYGRGERVPYLSRMHNLSERQIKRILKLPL